MIPYKIQALFDFIDYLDVHKKVYIETYLPICDELTILATQRANLNPDKNYIEKRKYDNIQTQISEKFQPITDNISVPILNKLRELGIWCGENDYTSIWNGNISAVSELKKDFTDEDAAKVVSYKEKYLRFRIETNSNFLCLELVLHELDEILIELFDFFKDTDQNEFDDFKTKTIEVNNMEEAIKGFLENKGKNVQFSFPTEVFFKQTSINAPQPSLTTINYETIMGNKINVGNITNNSGQVIVGKDVRVFDSFNDRSETIEKIALLIELIKKEDSLINDQKQQVIINFDKVKEELLELQPSKPKIYKWLTSAKDILTNTVLTHDVAETVKWIYHNLNFVFS
ncbi:MAG TPA: hypothetical protein VJA82_06610 [Sediminibacterium sp.]|uniref:hypothetical protein n=1 Tax=Sediminibacterium sp. TaxID=1917865 RepID=UPI0008B7679D|nr:hypothetical protein [Sediminibacterium sp.]OHC84654.1 MAG: hypothetical protein A2472_11930 [Sphingobacteriia bacterium RIFOXYC2_FULL_35_18]OHC87571.1 MAG: hypothetical protein A2546_08345 [Sphingobacteriia bacterium RIFOXYD2_FULL_35_12]HLD52955.1 hypothetical protein [Sediminibacterium sp.]